MIPTLSTSDLRSSRSIINVLDIRSDRGVVIQRLFDFSVLLAFLLLSLDVIYCLGFSKDLTQPLLDIGWKA